MEKKIKPLWLLIGCASWFVLSGLGVFLRGVTGEYLALWWLIVFLYGCLGVLVLFGGLKKDHRYLIIAGSAFVLLLVATYLLWPFTVSVTVVNSKGDPLVAEITLSDTEQLHQGDYHTFQRVLWKGTYTLQIETEGYDVKTITIKNPIGLKLNKDITQVVELDPRMIPLNTFTYVDPTHTLQRQPTIIAKGVNVLGDDVYQELTVEDALMYGVYSLTLSDESFQASVDFKNDHILVDGATATEVVLKPNDQFVVITEQEAQYTLNFLDDYIAFSQRNILDSWDRGFPQQFYLAQHDMVVTLGNMVFLTCLHDVYEKNNRSDRTYFLRKDSQYYEEGRVFSTQECYAFALDNEIPKTIGGDSTAKHIAWMFTSDVSYPYEFGDLNRERRMNRIAFTFDIESGRYVYEDNGFSISPCEGKDYATGLEEHERICDDPAFVAWMSPRDEEITYTEFTYPQVSGLLGYRDIIDYSIRYGLPTTHYIVQKDIKAFEQLDPELIENARQLASDGVVEIGSHTRYHTDLSRVSSGVVKEEIQESKQFLETFFNVSVAGFRAPYLNEPSDRRVMLRALRDAGYTYYSHYGSFEILPEFQLIHKPWSGGAYGGSMTPQEFKSQLNQHQTLITLDHPWNMVYDDGETLQENLELLDNYRALVLTAYTRGAIPVLLRDV